MKPKFAVTPSDGGENQASAFLFVNGAAIFFDADGQQISRFQRRDWAGLWGFLAAFPGAPVKIAKWRAGSELLTDAAVNRLLLSLRNARRRG
jgi:hypothetical protein